MRLYLESATTAWRRVNDPTRANTFSVFATCCDAVHYSRRISTSAASLVPLRAICSRSASFVIKLRCKQCKMMQKWKRKSSDWEFWPKKNQNNTPVPPTSWHFSHWQRTSPSNSEGADEHVNRNIPCSGCACKRLIWNIVSIRISERAVHVNVLGLSEEWGRERCVSFLSSQLVNHTYEHSVICAECTY